MTSRPIVVYDANVLYPAQLRDFPEQELKPHHLEAIHPDLFVLSLFEAHPERLQQLMKAHRVSLRRPPKSPEAYLAMLERAGLRRTIKALRVMQVSL